MTNTTSDSRVPLNEFPTPIFRFSEGDRLKTQRNQESRQLAQILEAIRAFCERLGLELDCDMDLVAQELRALDMSMSGIETIDPFTFFPHLLRLDAGGNLITEIPETIGQLADLEMLSLYGNRITEVPTAIGELKNLKTLYLDSNRISVLPDEMGGLTALEELYLDENIEITSLPDWIGCLTKLRILHLNGNPVTNISEKILDLPNLVEVHLLASTVTLEESPVLLALSHKGVKVFHCR